MTNKLDKPVSNRTALSCLAAAGAIVIWGAVSDPEGTNAVADQYCSMWEIWHIEALDGVPAKKRNGWPDPHLTYFEECNVTPRLQAAAEAVGFV